MTQRVLVTNVSDLSEAEVGPTGQDFRFTYRSREYSIDLTDDEVAEFDRVMEKYLRAASRPAGKHRRIRSVATGPDPRTVRAWARAKGITVPDKGRIPYAVMERFAAAGN